MPIAATFVSVSSFTTAGDRTAELTIGVRVQADCGADGIRLGSVTASSYDGDTDRTTVSLLVDTGELTGNLVAVLHGNDTPETMPRANEDHFGAVRFATTGEVLAAATTSSTVAPASMYQAFLSWMRDTHGIFPGIVAPSFNLFCGNATDDGAPEGTFTRSTTGTRLGQAGSFETVAAGQVRREWDTSGNLLGWLIEESRTNLFSYNSQFDDASWIKVRSTVTADTAMAPDGTTSADKLLLDATASTTHYAYKTCTFTAGLTYTFSIYARPAELSLLALTLPSDGFGSVQWAIFDLAAGEVAITGGSPATAMTPLENGYYRCGLTATATDTSSGKCVLYLAQNNVYSSVDGDGVSGLPIWGAQIETGSVPTSNIPTTSSAVARAADVWSVPLDSSWFNAAAGTLFVAGHTATGAPAPEAVQILAQYDDGSSSNRLRILWDADRTLRCIVTTAGAETANLDLGTVAELTPFRVAFSWSSSGVSASRDGGACLTDAAVTLPSTLTTTASARIRRACANGAAMCSMTPTSRSPWPTSNCKP